MADLSAFFGLYRQDLSGLFEDIIASGQVISGPQVLEAERAIASLIGTKHAVAVNNGTAALQLACQALGVGAERDPTDCVVTTCYSFIASASAPALARAKVSLVDVDPDTFNMDPNALRNRLSELQKAGIKPKAIIPVHLFGQSADMKSILAVAAEYEVPVIEDAAQAIGANCTVNGAVRKVGSIGKVGCFSFYPTKNLPAVGSLGMVVTNDEEVARRVRILRNHGAISPYEHAFLSGNYKPDELPAGSVVTMLSGLENVNAVRRTNAQFYTEALSELDQQGRITLPKVKAESDTHVWHHFVIRATDRDDLQTSLVHAGVPTMVYYPVPLHRQKALQHDLIGDLDFPVAERLSRESLALPIHPMLTLKQLERVVHAVKQHYLDVSLA
jgi:dTDP-4-amino-4,6-dideoxygalactose transaminase